jgi:hypothetical protein
MLRNSRVREEIKELFKPVEEPQKNLQEYVKELEEKFNNKPAVKGSKIKVIAKPHKSILQILTEESL